jgi:hypothetical protein
MEPSDISSKDLKAPHTKILPPHRQETKVERTPHRSCRWSSCRRKEERMRGTPGASHPIPKEQRKKLPGVLGTSGGASTAPSPNTMQGTRLHPPAPQHDLKALLVVLPKQKTMHLRYHLSVKKKKRTLSECWVLVVGLQPCWVPEGGFNSTLPLPA